MVSLCSLIYRRLVSVFSSDLDENLQKAFHKYLEIRGIKPSAINFLHEYMINKNSREELNWLKKLKNFVEA
jgi:complement component 1 Q subcomponent-binding protein